MLDRILKQLGLVGEVGRVVLKHAALVAEHPEELAAEEDPALEAAQNQPTAISNPAVCSIKHTIDKFSQIFKNSASVKTCSNFGTCSVTCGGGTQICSNSCIHGKWGEDGCETSKKTTSQDCNKQTCRMYSKL